MIAGDNRRSLGQSRMARQRRKEFGPFGRTAGIGDIAGDQDMIERLLRMNGRKPFKNPRKPVVAAWPRPPAFDAKAILLADDMDIGQMRDTP